MNINRINWILFSCLIVVGMTSCGSGGDKYHITIKCGDKTYSKGDADIGWSSSGGNTTAFFGFGKSSDGSLKILGVADAVKESETVEDVVGKKFDCEVEVGKVNAESGVFCSISSFEAVEGKEHSKMFGQEYIMKGTLEGEFNGEMISQGSFSIKTYKKAKE